MASVSTAVAALGEPDAWVRVLTVGGITFGVLFVVLLLVGIALLIRRRGGRDEDASRALATRANILLVRVDDEVASSEDELGFALAQFGDEITTSFSITLERAKEQLNEAFALRQRLDDSTPESETQRRGWVLRIIQLCENAATALADERARFELLRRRERNAPRDLQELRRLIGQVRETVPTAKATLTRLTAGFQPSALGGVSDNATEAEQLLGDAAEAADTAETALARDAASPVADTLRSGREAAERASELLASLDRRASALDAAAEQVEHQVAAARADLEEARAVRDAPPDADTGAAVAAAMTGLEAVLAALEAEEAPRDPFAASVRFVPPSMRSTPRLPGPATSSSVWSTRRRRLPGRCPSPRAN